MVFHPPAPRCVTRDMARKIIEALPPFVTPVGLFVDAAVAEIRELVESLGLRHVQLHGHEPAETVAALADRIILKAVRVAPESLPGELSRWKQAIGEKKLNNLRGLLLETAGKGVGGTGIENDWAMIVALQKNGSFDGLPPIIAAGGLRPENVGGVIRQLRPWAADVSSGVESSPGRKSHEKIEAFVNEVREADRITAA